ncbi:hypothetical protein F441_00062 [Phytophthora nicotianae CJ01A1]|uniref:Uncharacterized protein n=1 Tax=Phytophthora nicotianae CJ01A1 TaxID=1317063 RepID=W2XZS1_PHYNI|nr:hypothetical protein F441_00062 [Phytophthora nicotianae CJ01A1]
MQGYNLYENRSGKRVVAVCVHDQARWDATWKEVLGDLINSRRVVIPPDVFFDVLEANNVVLGRSEVRLLWYQFQEPNGAMLATKFLRWIALNAPADHVDPDLQFTQLPQPYRRIKKILDYDIFDGAWETIKLESTRYKSESTTQDATESSRSRRSESNHDQLKDYDVARSRSCGPSRRIPLESEAQKVVGHCLVPVVVAAINNDNAPTLRIISTSDDNVKVLGDFPIAFPLEAVAAGTAETITNTHVSIKQLSALQLATESSCGLAVHVMETTTTEFVSADLSTDVQLPTSATRECVNIYTVKTSETEFCQLVAVVTPQSPESSISSIILSPDSKFLAVTSVSSAVVALYFIDHDQGEHQPLALTSPAFRIDPESTRSSSTEEECRPKVHFLVAPCTSRPQTRVPNTYALAVCHELKLLKYVLPSTDNTSASSSPVLLTPVRLWEHLAKITASAQDLTTQYVAVGCQDGSIVVWDVLRDVDYAFLSSEDKASISSVILYQAEYVVALSKAQQRLYFFDVRERGKLVLTRVVSSSMTSLTLSAADIPLALVQFSSGMVIFYDVRTAEAIGSLAQSSSSSIVGNQEVLAAVAEPPDAQVNVYSWRDILLVCFPSFQRQEELTSSNIKKLFSSDTGAGSLAFAPSSITTQSTAVDLLETVLLRMADELPSPQRGQKSSAPSPIALHSTSYASLPSPDPHNKPTDNSVMLQPVVPDHNAFFEQYCNESLDTLAIADKEATLHRKRRELLKVMVAGGAW